jgi:hypothetical protein
MRAFRLGIAAFVTGLLAVAAAAVDAQTTSFSFQSQPGDFVGQGQSKSFTPADGTFTFTHNFDNGVSMTFVHATQPGVTWNADFAAAGNALLTVGAYEDVVRFPFQTDSQNALDISGEGRGYNQLIGRFDVFDIEYGPGASILRFAADFEQRGQNFDGTLFAPMFGQVRFNTTVPEPGSSGAAAALGLALLRRCRRRGTTIDR